MQEGRVVQHTQGGLVGPQLVLLLMEVHGRLDAHGSIHNGHQGGGDLGCNRGRAWCSARQDRLTTLTEGQCNTLLCHAWAVPQHACCQNPGMPQGDSGCISCYSSSSSTSQTLMMQVLRRNRFAARPVTSRHMPPPMAMIGSWRLQAAGEWHTVGATAEHVGVCTGGSWSLGAGTPGCPGNRENLLVCVQQSQRP